MFNRMRELHACPRYSEASSCENCVDIQTRMLFRKALGGSPDPADGQRKVIRNIIALAEEEGISRSDILHLGPHFYVEYGQLYENDSIEDWNRFEKSHQCRTMVKKHFPTLPTIPSEPPKGHPGFGLSRSLTQAMTSSLERLGTWANSKDGPHLSKKLSEGKTNKLSRYLS